MKTNIILSLLIALFMFSCSEADEAGNGGENATKPVEETLKSFTIDLNGVDNLIVQSAVMPSQSISFASYSGSGNLFYNKDGALFNVEIPTGYAVKKVYDIKGSDNIAISFYVDSTSDTQTVTTCVIDIIIQECTPLLYEPRKLSNLGNSPYFQQVGTDILHLEENNLIQSSTITSLTNSISLASVPDVIAQISINDNGDMMIDTGTEISISASFDMIIPDLTALTNQEWMAELTPNANKFFFPYKDGFLLKGGVRNDFYELYDSSGDLGVRFLQENAYWQYTNVGGGFNRIFNNTSLAECTSHIVADDSIMICGSKAYDLGDASNDIKLVDFWSYGIISGSERRVLSDDNFLYVYSSSTNEGDFLARIDINIMDHFDIFDRNVTSYGINSESINGNTYRACTNNSILEILTIDATPDIIETIGECSQIISF